MRPHACLTRKLPLLVPQDSRLSRRLSLCLSDPRSAPHLFSKSLKTRTLKTREGPSTPVLDSHRPYGCVVDSRYLLACTSVNFRLQRQFFPAVTPTVQRKLTVHGSYYPKRCYSTTPENNSASRSATVTSEPERENNSAAPQPLSLPVAQFGGSGGLSFPAITQSPTLDAALTTLIGLAIVFLGGVGYITWYKARVLTKIEQAFSAGYDPALELANGSSHAQNLTPTESQTESSSESGHLRRREQDIVDEIISGGKPGQYFLIMGSKGTGKGSMVLDAMRAVRADGIAFCEAHEDLEVFRHRLGRALNFEYMEDSQTGLFQRRDPREGGPALDIERALSKLEKVALTMSKRRGKPLVLCINNIHMLDDNEESIRLLRQLQQRAEAWAGAGILTMVFTTDDFWPFPILRKNANRLRVLSVSDLTRSESIHALKLMSPSSISEQQQSFDQVLELVGGRLSILSKIAHSSPSGDGARMVEVAKEAVAAEKAWIMSRIGLIPDCDDDVMDEQKWSSCSWLLMREFVNLHKENEAVRLSRKTSSEGDSDEEIVLPAIPYWRCRQIMTRPDFLETLDHDNLISIDVHHNVRPDSMLVLQAVREVVEEEGFDDLLDGVRARVDEIESLHRTSELTFKDLFEGGSLRVDADKSGFTFRAPPKKSS